MKFPKRDKSLGFIGCYIPKPLKEAFRAIARRERRTISKQLEVLIEQGVKHHEGGQ